MQVDHLRYFSQIVQGQSLTACSKQMHISQQGLSQLIISLENELDCELLNRTNKGVYFTDAGKKLMECSKIFLDALHQITIEENPIDGVLFLPVAPYIVASYLKNTIGQFMRENPYVQLSFSYTNMISESLNYLMEGKAELAFVCNPDQKSDIVFQQLIESCNCKFVYCKSFRACVDCHKDFFQELSLESTSVSKTTLEKYTAMINVYDEINKQHSIPLFWQNQRYSPNTLYETNREVYLQFLRNKAGYGVSVYYEDKFQSDDTLTQLFIKDGPSIDYGYIVKKDTVLSPQAQRFLDTLKLN